MTLQYIIQNTIIVYPYNTSEEAKERISHAEKHFDDAFNVKKFRDGYILTSKDRILDSRGFVVSNDSPLERGKEAFEEIINGSISVLIS